jgi:hypothetical protein
MYDKLVLEATVEYSHRHSIACGGLTNSQRLLFYKTWHWVQIPHDSLTMAMCCHVITSSDLSLRPSAFHLLMDILVWVLLRLLTLVMSKSTAPDVPPQNVPFHHLPPPVAPLHLPPPAFARHLRARWSGAGPVQDFSVELQKFFTNHSLLSLVLFHILLFVKQNWASPRVYLVRGPLTQPGRHGAHSCPGQDPGSFRPQCQLQCCSDSRSPHTACPSNLSK